MKPITRVMLITLLSATHTAVLMAQENNGNLPIAAKQGIYLYQDKQDCLEKNKGSNGIANENIKMVCDAAIYPQTKEQEKENQAFIYCKMNGGCDQKGNLLHSQEEAPQSMQENSGSKSNSSSNARYQDPSASSLSFICKTEICVHQYLGIGYKVLEDKNTLIYSNYEREYKCTRSRYIYNCQ